MDEAAIISSENTTIVPNNNTSGQGKDALVPLEIRGWNWGAFGFNWIWAIGNKVWIGLLGLIPVVNIIMMFVLGAKGNDWAWQARHWDSVEHFKKVQKIWTRVWLILLLIGIVVHFCFAIIYPIIAGYTRGTPQQNAQSQTVGY